MKKNNKRAHGGKTAPIETFLFCPNLMDLKKPLDPSRFFNSLSKLEEKLSECVVFFNLPSALQYSRFMSDDSVVLRAFVEHTAIEGLGHRLGVKKGALTQDHIHGCFPGWTKGSTYVENPAFKKNPLNRS
jgi:hypothetical protein